MMLERSELTFGEVVLVYRASHMAGLKPSIRGPRETILEAHLLPRFGDMPISDVNENGAGQLPAAGRRSLLGVLRCILRYAEKRQLIERAVLRPPPEMPAERVLSDRQLHRLFAACPPELVVPMGLMAYAGLRVWEVTQVRWKNVTPEFVEVPPEERWSCGRAPRKVPMSVELAEILAKVARGLPDDEVLSQKNGGPWKPLELRRAINRAWRAAKLKAVRVHPLRRYAMVKWLKGGVAIAEVAARVGSVERIVRDLKEKLKI